MPNPIVTVTDPPSPSMGLTMPLRRTARRPGRWLVLSAMLCAVLVVGSGAWSIAVGHRDSVQADSAAVDAHLHDLDRNLQGLFAPILAGLRATGASIVLDSPNAQRRLQATLEAVQKALLPGLPIELQWFVVGPGGAVLASAPATADAVTSAVQNTIASAGWGADRAETPTYQVTHDDRDRMLHIALPIRQAGEASAGAVVARLPVAIVHDRLFAEAVSSDVVLFVHAGRQVLVEHHDAAAGPAVAALSRLASGQTSSDAHGPSMAGDRIAGNGPSYRVQVQEHPEWGIRAVVAVADRGLTAGYSGDVLRVGMVMLGLVGLTAIAWWHSLHVRTTLIRAIRQRRRSHHAATRLLDSLPQPIVICSADRARSRVNAAMLKFLGLPGDSGRLLDWSRTLGAGEQATWNEALRRAHQSGQSSWLAVTLQGAGGWCDAMARIVPARQPLFDDEGTTLVILHPAQAPAESELGAPQLHELLRMAEAEKWHFGQALHDDLSQHLSGLAFVSNVLEQKLRKEARPEAEDALWLARLAKVSIDSARALARGMVPVNSDDPGALALALREMCEQTRSVFGVECRLEADPRFDAGGLASANHLFHAVKELVANGVKHGHAETVVVRLESVTTGRRISVLNDGEDLPPRSGTASRGMGLSGVRVRVAQLGGKFMLSSAPSGQGVLAVIDLPPAASAQAPMDGGLAEATAELPSGP
jgi:signal transduction histidine kinase